MYVTSSIVDSRFQFPKQGWTRQQRVGLLSQLILKQMVSANSLNQDLLLNWDDANNLWLHSPVMIVFI